MSKSIISIRLEKSVVDALDQVGFSGSLAHANRSQLIETILKLFFEQDFAVQRIMLTEALGSYRRRRGDDDPSC